MNLKLIVIVFLSVILSFVPINPSGARNSIKAPSQAVPLPIPAPIRPPHPEIAAQQPAAPVTINFACIVPFDADHLRIYFGWSKKQPHYVTINLADSNTARPFQTVPARYRNSRVAHMDEFYLTLMARKHTAVFELVFHNSKTGVVDAVLKFHTADFKNCR